MACGTVYIKVAGVWQPISAGDGTLYVKVGGVWKTVSNAFVKTGGVWYNTICNVVPGNITYNVPGVYNFLVPAGVTSINYAIQAAGGGGGGASHGGCGQPDGGGGGGGGGGEFISGTVAVVPSTNIAVVIGAGGAFGFNNQTFCGCSLACPGGAGGNSSFGALTAIGGGAGSGGNGAPAAGGVGGAAGGAGATAGITGDFPVGGYSFGGAGGNSASGTGGFGGHPFAYNAGPAGPGAGGGGAGSSGSSPNDFATQASAGGDGYITLTWG